MTPWLALVASYLIGSFPSAYLAGRLLKGVDLRTVGSGNLGATNVYRELGALPALIVLLLDAAKGWIPVAVLPTVLTVAVSEWWPLSFGMLAIAGHARPIFLLGRGGGKGVATASGVFLALAPIALAVAVSSFVIVVVATRFVSLGSIVAALVLPPAVAVTLGTTAPVFLVSVLVALFIVIAHRANLGRLRRGTESRLGRAGGAS
jgi:glycerol-3-phosphate acyltransferase PlsY